MSKSTQIYFPNDLKRKLSLKNAYIIGYKLNNIYIIFDFVSDAKVDYKEDELINIGSLNRPDDRGLTLYYQDNQLSTKISSIIIFFDPPNFRNLEYFSIESILLQSMEQKKKKKDSEIMNKLIKFEENILDKECVNFVSDEIVLDKLNQLYRTRVKIKASNHRQRFQLFKTSFKLIIIPIIQCIQYILIFLINLINFNIAKGYSLTKVSKVFKQLDLRLKQFNYFPIQFLCYYDRNILYNSSSVINDLKLPIFNTNLNINNSNYINLYNSLWLILNDILLGATIYLTFIENFSTIINFIQTTLFNDFLFNRMIDLIDWISNKNPAGFKLNHDLGKFLGDLYIWTIYSWESLIMMNIKSKNFRLLKSLIYIMCYYGGCTFLIAFLIDLINLFTIHIYSFYYCSLKIYRKQLDIIKSLFQLFRGKKYNVLKHRIDNLNNYQPGINSYVEIDQLLLGTLLFMIMILLLPTTFAFYLMFCILYIMTLMSVNFLENLQIIINFTPLFVILLKLKNSNRLQGGLKFEFVDMFNNTTMIKLSNKSLTYDEIFKNYLKLFKKAKNFRKSIIKNVLVGELILIKYDNNLMFHYLMLPENYNQTCNVWKYIKD